MYYIGLDVHKKTISYCVKDASGQIYRDGKISATRQELDIWVKTLPQPWTVAMEATIFTGWIYDHLLPHAKQIKVAHPLMLRAIAAFLRLNAQQDSSPSFTSTAAATLSRGRQLPASSAVLSRAVLPTLNTAVLPHSISIRTASAAPTGGFLLTV